MGHAMMLNAGKQALAVPRKALGKPLHVRPTLWYDTRAASSKNAYLQLEIDQCLPGLTVQIHW